VKLATYFQPVPRLRINGAIPLQDLMACTVTTLLYCLSYVLYQLRCLYLLSTDRLGSWQAWIEQRHVKMLVVILSLR